MKAKFFRILLGMILLLQTAALRADAEVASASFKAETGKKTSWLQQKIDERLERSDRERERQPETGWKIKPGVTFRWKRKGMDWSIGPRLGLARQVSEQGRLTINASYLPIRYTELKSGSRVDYTRFDIGYRHFFTPRLFAGFGLALHRFNPDREFSEEIAARGGKARDGSITATALSIGQQVLKVDWSYRGKKRTLPFFLELTWQQAEDYQYGADLGLAGSEYKIKSGYSLRFRPLTRKF